MSAPEWTAEDERALDDSIQDWHDSMAHVNDPEPGWFGDERDELAAEERER